MKSAVMIAWAMLCLLVASGQAADRVIPQPKNLQWHDGQLRLNASVRIESKDHQAAETATQALQAMHVPVKGEVHPRAIPCRIQLLAQPGVDPTSVEAQTYQLRIDELGITIKTGGRPGLAYALATLEQLIKRDALGAYLPHVTIEDNPAMPLRGGYLNLRQVKATEPESLQVLRDLIDTLASVKVNALVVEISDNMRYDSRRFPAREKTAFTKDQMRDLVAYARSRHMEVIPYLQTLSHVSWILSNPENVALLEDPSNKGWHTAWCPSKPETKAFIEDVLRETVEVFQPRFVHVGLDEVNWGPYYQCEDCRKRERSEIFLAHILHLHGFLTKRNARMVMFHDDLLEVPNRYSRHNRNAAAVEGWKVRDRLPKDIVLNTYFYNVDRPEFKRQTDLFTGLGFQVMGMPFNVMQGIKQSADRMAAVPQALGNIMSYWHYAGDWSRYGISPESAASTTLVADLSWNADVELETLGYDPVWEFMRRWKKLDPNANRKPLTSHPLELTGLFNQRVFSTRGSWPTAGAAVSDCPFDGERVFDDMRFALGAGPNHPNALVLSGGDGDGFSATSAPILVRRPVQAVAFVHASDVPANIETLRQKNRNTPQLARYTFVYDDGTYLEQPIQYGVQITEWNDRLAPTDGRVAIETNDDDGNRVMFTRWIWINPHPEKVLRHVELVSNQYEKASIAILAVTALSDDQDVIVLDDMSYKTAEAFLDVWKMQRSGLSTLPRLTANPSEQTVEIRVPQAGATLARLILDRDIPVMPEPGAGLGLCFEVFLEKDGPDMVQFGVYMAEDKADGGWGKSAVKYLKLRPGMNRVSIDPQTMNATGEAPDLAKVSQLRLSFWFTPQSPEMGLVIGGLQWQSSIHNALHKGAWYD